MNNLTILLIDCDYVKERSTIMSNVEETFIKTNIFQAQDIYIQQVLGSALYEDVLNDFDLTGGTFIQSKYTTLVEDYIQPMLLYYSIYESIDDLYAKYTNKSILIQNSENSTPISEEYLSKRKADFLNKAEFYSERLTKFLLRYQTTYPLYLNHTSYDDTIEPDTESAYAHNGWYLGDTSGDICSGPYSRFHRL